MRRSSNIFLSSSELAAEVEPIQSVRLSARSSFTTSDGFSLDRLNFSSLGLYGREEEVSKLREAYRGVQSEEIVNLVLLSGYTGVGKSAIVKKFQNDIDRADKYEDEHHFFSAGKFDLQKRIEPYTAFVSAFTHLCEGILSLQQGREQVFDQIKQSIREAVGSEGAILFDIMPNLHEIIGDLTLRPSFDANEEFGTTRAKNRFNFILRQFARSVCKFFPIVLFLDDLQWADAASLELLETLITDSELTHMLVVGCYRSNEVDDAHPLSVRLREFETYSKSKKQDKSGIRSTRIVVDNLDAAVIHDLITDVLDSQKSKTQNLANVIYEKTLGNVFFVIQFIKMLKDEKLLNYNIGMLCWKWDDEQIRASTTVADNVADLVRLKIQNKLPSKVACVLQIAACLGATFADSTVSLVAKRLWETDDWHWNSKELLGSEDGNDVNEIINDCLYAAVREGLLEVIEIGGDGQQRLNFVHDQIQLAALSLIPKDDLGLLQYRIGEALVENQTEAEVDKVLFVAVDMLNNGSVLLEMTEEKRVSLARLNLRAGARAMESSAFVSAASYVSTGKRLMGERHWEKHYQLSLELYNLSIKADYCIGNFEQVFYHVDQILGQKNKPIDDKLGAYSSLVATLGAQGRVTDAIDTSLTVLAELGACFQLKFAVLSTISQLLKTRRLLKGRPLLTLSDLPVMEDRLKIKAMQIMNRCCTYAYAGKPELLPLLIFKMMQWSLQYGVCEYSTTAFALYGLALVSLFGDLKAADEIGKVALTLSEKLNAVSTSAATIAYVNACLSHWVEPLHVRRNNFLNGYDVGLRTGDIENAMLCAMNYCHVCYETGQPLSEVETDLRAFITQMREYDQTLILNVAAVIWQAVLNLMGRSEDPMVLTGEAMNQDEILLQCADTGNVQLIDAVKAFQMEMAYIFGDFNLASRLAYETRNLAQTNPASYVVWRCSLFEGLTAFAMAHQGRRQRKWKKKAKRVMRKVKSWVSNGNANCIHIFHLFEAEQFALDSRTEQAKRQYDLAVSSAARNGFPQDRALANERAGEMFHRIGDRQWAAHYLQLAYQLYVDWEASEKAERLLRKHSEHIHKS